MTMVTLVNTPTITHGYQCLVYMVITHKLYFLGNFQVDNTGLLPRVTMLLSFLKCCPLRAESLCPWTSIF